MRSWFEDFTATSQKRMDQYLGGDVDAIETIENLDVFFTTARLHNNVFSQGLEQASGVSAKAALGGLTESEADILARQVMNLHYKGGGVDSFGQIDGWAGLMKDSSDFVNSLKRSQLVDKNRATRLLASMNKAFKDFATFGPGFALRNATGRLSKQFHTGREDPNLRRMGTKLQHSFEGFGRRVDKLSAFRQFPHMGRNWC